MEVLVQATLWWRPTYVQVHGDYTVEEVGTKTDNSAKEPEAEAEVPIEVEAWTAEVACLIGMCG